MIDLTPSQDPASRRRIRFVSDLHLGNPGAHLTSADQFARLIDGCDVLVVCGDFVETRDCPYFEEGERLRGEFEKVCREARVELVLLSGNHDPDHPEAIATACGGKLVALHGHELFSQVAPWGREYLYNKKLARQVIARFPEADGDLTQCLDRARAMSVFVPPFIRKKSKRGGLIDLVKNAGWPPTRGWRILWAWLTMCSRMSRFTRKFFPEAQVVCYGHFHRRHIALKGGRLYVNTGALFKHSKAYGVDLEGTDVCVYEWTADGWGKRVYQYTLKENDAD